MKFIRRALEPREQHRWWIDPRVWNLPLDRVTDYLIGTGWSSLASDRPNFLVFAEPQQHLSGDVLVQFVPSQAQSADYPQRMFELISGLAVFEQRQATDILDDILKTPPTTVNGSSSEMSSPLSPSVGN
jgi:hypothetical protein